MNKYLLAMSFAYLFVGCGVYHSEFKCSGGSDISYCASVSDIYYQKNNDKKYKQTQEKDYTRKEFKKLENENERLKLIIQSKENQRLKGVKK
ncbi:hypothetical protein [Campylobacter sp. MG1]|uniref:hypothetical protein n=1 Tax=Campylobacter sp. MG1 TaxID=2976332 RepID=UPI00226C835D|nr:hypothetical protein [Campylobacter sp. MG1]